MASVRHRAAQRPDDLQHNDNQTYLHRLLSIRAEERNETAINSVSLEFLFDKEKHETNKQNSYFVALHHFSC